MLSLSAPTARIDELITAESGEDLLVYDQRNHHIHHLNPVSAAIWRMCDGQHGAQEMLTDFCATGVNATEESIWQGVRALAAADLLQGPLGQEFVGATQSRRRFMKQAAAAGAVAVPTIVSVTASAAAQTAACTARTSCIGLPDGEPCCDKEKLGSCKAEKCTGKAP
jgi:hypothetical protein